MDTEGWTNDGKCCERGLGRTETGTSGVAFFFTSAWVVVSPLFVGDLAIPYVEAMYKYARHEEVGFG